ncbi:Biotinidase [Mactra antiquata]
MEWRCTVGLFIIGCVVTMGTCTKVKVAVYEHVVISPDDPENYFPRREAFRWMSKNLDVLARQAKIASGKGAKMIVFPEYGITGFDHSRDSIITFLEDVPNAEEEWNPCIDPDRHKDTMVLRNISCIARDNFIYVVANMGDIKKCNVTTDVTCPKDGRYQFNTNVVFDRHGKLVARYHKRHMYDETPLFDPAPTPEYVTFDTPFGKFGTIVCFDLLHYKPTQVLIDEYSVDNLVVTSAWNVFYPFVIPLQMYSGLAKRNQVNVIASNIRNSDYYMAGSGIFGDGVEVNSDLNFYDENGVLLVAEIETKPNKVRHGKQLNHIMKPEIRPKVDVVTLNSTNTGKYDYGMNMTYVLLNKMSGYADVCREMVCCAVDYKFNNRDPDENFILAAVDVVLTEPGALHMQFCAVHKCATDDLKTCGSIVTSANSSFSKLTVEGRFDHGIVFPFVSTTTLGESTDIHMEMDSYVFDHDNAILQADKLEHPLLAAVVFNSLFNESEIWSDKGYNVGESTSNSECASLSIIAKLIVLVAYIIC